MIILYGTKTKMEKEIWAGAEDCPVCGITRDRFLARKRTAFTLFYIPIVWFNAGRYIISCENCQTGAKLKKKQYNETRDELMRAYEKGEFPAYVANQYYNKKSLGKTWSVVKVILAWIWALLMGYVAVTSGAKALVFASKGLPDVASIAITAAAVLLAVIPLVKTHKGLSKINKMLRIAELYEGKADAPAVEEKVTPAAPAEVEPAAENAAVPAAEAQPAPASEENAPVSEINS